MNTYAVRRRSILLVALLLLVSILLEQYWVVPLMPWISGLGGIRPMIVFLDIPLGLPMTIDLIPVGVLFSFFYSIVLVPGLPRAGQLVPALRKKVGGVLMGLSAILVSMLAGGGLFYLLQDYLPRPVRNGIDSFGIQADLYLPYPGEGIVHVRGSMILLAVVCLGIWTWVRKTTIKPAKSVTETGMGKRISMQIPETAVERGRIYPCVVEMEMVPRAGGK